MAKWKGISGLLQKNTTTGAVRLNLGAEGIYPINKISNYNHVVDDISNSITLSALIGSILVEVVKSGLGYSVIYAGVPLNEQVLFNTATGTLTFSTELEIGEEILMLSKVGTVVIPTPINMTGKNAIWLGDSIFQGAISEEGANSRETNRFSKLYSNATGAVEVNQGVSGKSLESGSNGGNPIYASGDISTKGVNDGRLYVGFGVNDALFNLVNHTPKLFKEKLIELVENALSKDWEAKDLVLVTPFPANQTGMNSYIGNGGVTKACTPERLYDFREACIDVAQAYHTVLADLYTFFDELPDRDDRMYSDGIHPNYLGAQSIASFFINLSYTPQ